MTLEAGSRFGAYEIVRPIGSGGMGEVYRATDTRLGRDVAIKVLPASVAEDPVRRARFEREAHAIAQLSHPNICTLFDAGEQDGVPFLAMEFIHGESLEHRLRAGPVGFTTAVPWAIQIAGALDAAHRLGIVHRDLKPANIIVGDAGVKLVDFGVAKLVEATDAPRDAAPLPTASLTAEQRMVGTIHYMAPEQLEGREVDARTDLFALGVTLYEMLTGRKPFDGSSAATITAAILTLDPPPVSSSVVRPALVPAALDHVVQRALAKDPQDRWQTARDLMIELRSLLDGRARSRRSPGDAIRRWLGTAAAAAAIAALGIFVGTRWPHAATPPPAVTFTISPPPGTRFHQGFGRFAVSPDSRKVAFVAGPPDGTPRLWVQTLDSPIAKQLPGTDDANGPFWSPDSRSIVFYRNQGSELARVNVEGGAPVRLVQLASRWLGLTPSGLWRSSDNQIVFSQLGGLFGVSPAGGDAVPISRVDAASGERQRALPAELPKGRLLYLSVRDFHGLEMHVEGTGLTKAVTLPIESNANYAAGHLLFRQDDTLFAQPYDTNAVQLSGHPLAIAEGVSFNPGNGRTAFSVSEDLLVYRRVSPLRLTWMDRSGMSQGSMGEIGRDWNPVISPDGSEVAVDRYDPARRSFQIWIIDGQGRSRQATHGIRERFAVWSPDAHSLIYVAVNPAELHRTQLAGADTRDEALYHGDSGEVWPALIALDCTRDGRFLIFQSGGADDLWALPLQGADHHPIRLTDTPWRETTARVSPDSRWLAYTSTEDGVANIWVQPFPTGPRRRVSSKGGTDPSWRADGRELYYLAPDGTITAVAVDPLSPTFGVSTPLFTFDPGSTQNPVHTYSVTPDGQRFLVNEATGAQDVLTAILHWTSLLK